MAWEILGGRWIITVLIVILLCIGSVLGNWSLWGEWSDEPCSVTCGEGNKVSIRTRFCNNPENNCAGSNVDKKTVRCRTQIICGDLVCYECNIFRSGKIVACDRMTETRSCRACMKSYTRIHLHDRVGYTKDSIVESRLCVQHHDFSNKAEEGCVYHRNNGGVTAVCHCFSDRCNSGVRQGSSLAVILFMGFTWIWQYWSLDVVSSWSTV